MGKKIKIEDVKIFIEKYNYICFDNEYINSKFKLKLLCPNKHYCYINLNCFKNGTRCSECARNKKLTLNDIIQHALKENYLILSKSINNSTDKVKFKCPNGHEFSMKYTNFKHLYQRCPICSKRKYSIESIQNYLNKEGYHCTNEKYINYHSALNFICPNGHSFSMSFANFKSQNRRCYQCLNDKKLILTLEKVKKIINNENYICTSTNYINNQYKLDLICPKNHSFKMRFLCFNRGDRCPICSKSKSERTIRYLLETMIGKSLPSIYHKLIINPKTNRCLQLDGFNEELNFAFEYQGIQHYQITNSFNHDKNKLLLLQERDLFKKNKCEELGIKLLIIPTVPNKIEPKDLENFFLEKLNSFKIKIINKMPDFYNSMKFIINN
jgi:hypothetical protein